MNRPGRPPCVPRFSLRPGCCIGRRAGRQGFWQWSPRPLPEGAPFAGEVFDFVRTQSKNLGRSLRSPLARHRFTQWSPVNRVDLCQLGNSRISFWANLGRSPKYVGMFPKSWSSSMTGTTGAMSITTRVRIPWTSWELICSVRRTLCSKSLVLVIGVGGGIHVMNAVWHGAAHVTGVELQPITISLLQGSLLKSWTGGIFEAPRG